MRQLTKQDAIEWIHRIDSESKVYTIVLHRSRFGKYYVWCERVVKLNEMDEDVASTFQRLMNLTKAQRLEAICNENTGEPDRIKVVIEP